MTLLKADIIVSCPKTNLKVSVDKQCLGDPRCPHYKHYAIQGNMYYVICSYKSEEP
mgnify:CR=1